MAPQHHMKLIMDIQCPICQFKKKMKAKSTISAIVRAYMVLQCGNTSCHHGSIICCTHQAQLQASFEVILSSVTF